MPAFTSPPVSSDGAAVHGTGPLPEGVGERRGVWLLMAGSCLPILGAVLLAPVLPKMQEHFAAAPGARVLIPMVLTIPALALALTAPVAGVVIDRLGRGRLLVVMSTLYALFGTAPLWLDSLDAIVVSRACLGVTEAFIMTSCTTLIGDHSTGRARHRHLALQTVCVSASATAFFVLGGALGSADWRTPFWLYAVGLLFAPATAVFLSRTEPGAAMENTTALEARPLPALRLTGICLLSVLGALVFYTVPVKTAFLLNGLGVRSSELIGIVTAIASAATVAGCVLFASLTGRPGRRLPAVFAVCGAGCALMAVAQNPLVLVVGAILNCVGTGFLLPSLVTWAMSGLSYGNRGRGTGLWIASFFLGQFMCPLALSAAESATGSLATAVGFLGLASLLTAAGLLPLVRRTA
ncbi:MFS transporter [Streptomyces cylindrosporus]|uniref:MFS transporter n=1 Tax=Streptomyces cylindrosporus TaxID=2927583 RepID=A0ABS9Y0I9_9ACTN|nr:MFS transporter [Streptomyces cylindrosporus]MCI3270699.1 MFS transporter [Streptomyces cylindrosporus]